MTEIETLDPRGLIHEAFNIEGILPGECRSIFLDWALSLPAEIDQIAALRSLIDHHQDKDAEHPMRIVLQDGLAEFGKPRRRGGWRSRNRP